MLVQATEIGIDASSDVKEVKRILPALQNRPWSGGRKLISLRSLQRQKLVARHTRRGDFIHAFGLLLLPGSSVLVVLTMLDEVDPTLRERPQDVVKSEPVYQVSK